MYFLGQSFLICKKDGLRLNLGFGVEGLSEAITPDQKGIKKIKDLYTIISNE